jgi:PAS domain S-box-containing protein
VFGTSPRRPLDSSYRAFFDLIARHVDTILRDALEYEDARRPSPELREGKQAEEAVRVNERRFRALVGDLSAAVYTCDAAGYITYFNEAAVALWGRKPEIGREQWCGSSRIRRPDGTPVALDTCPMAMALKGEPVSSGEELILERPDGTCRNVMAYPEAIRDASGMVSGAVNIILDVTAFKSAQQALLWSETRFRRYFELGLVGMAMTSPEKGILEVNDELCRILGYERSELQQKTWAELTHPDDLTADVAQFNRAMAGEIDSYTLDKRWIRKDGQVVDSIVSATCVRRSDGSVDYFMGLLQDITRRKRAEERIQESERRFHLLIESIPHLVWSFRTNGTLAYWNQRFADYTGLTEEELKQGAWSAVHPDDVPQLEQAWRSAWAHDAPFEMEYRLRRRDGSYRRFVCRGEPVSDSYGRMVEWFGTCTDVEERRLAQEDLHKAHLELAHITRLTAMGELAASIAHEINQPLGAIVNNANVGLRIAGTKKAASHEELRDVLSDIVDDASRGSAIITRLRELVQRGVPSRELLQPDDVVRKVLALAKPELTQRRVSVRLEIGADLPRVLGDQVQLQQVFLNLVMNAAEAMSAVPAERRILTIGGGLWQRNGQPAALITVHDVGCGFGTKDFERLFEAFYTTKPNGLGMGLRISRSIVEAHGGHVWAEANPDAGATFFVALPGSIPVD